MCKAQASNILNSPIAMRRCLFLSYERITRRELGHLAMAMEHSPQTAQKRGWASISVIWYTASALSLSVATQAVLGCIGITESPKSVAANLWCGHRELALFMMMRCERAKLEASLQRKKPASAGARCCSSSGWWQSNSATSAGRDSPGVSWSRARYKV